MFRGLALNAATNTLSADMDNPNPTAPEGHASEDAPLVPKAREWVMKQSYEVVDDDVDLEELISVR
jgi:hypothetical protein